MKLKDCTGVEPNILPPAVVAIPNELPPNAALGGVPPNTVPAAGDFEPSPNTLAVEVCPKIVLEVVGGEVAPKTLVPPEPNGADWPNIDAVVLGVPKAGVLPANGEETVVVVPNIDVVFAPNIPALSAVLVAPKAGGGVLATGGAAKIDGFETVCAVPNIEGLLPKIEPAVVVVCDVTTVCCPKIEAVVGAVLLVG